MSSIIVLALPEARRYAENVAKVLNAEFVEVETKDFPDGESYVRIPVSVSGKKVVVVSSVYPLQDKRLMKTFLLIDAAKDLDADRIIAVVPYFAYSRQDRRFRDGEPISLKTVLSILHSLGVDTVITVDVHKPAAFTHEKMRCINVEPFKLYADKIREILKSEPIVVLSPDFGSLWRAEKVARELNVEFDYFEKYRDRVTGQITMKPRQVNVEDKTVVIIDDIIATGGTMREAARYVKEMGARKVIAVATHCLFLENADAKLLQSGVDKIICSDTIETPYSEVYTSTLVGEQLRQILST